MISALVTILVPILAALFAGMSGYLISRRTTKGAINTSQASDLWKQTQDIIAAIQRDKERAEDQRDKLIEAFSGKIFPAVESTLQSVQAIIPAVGIQGELFLGIQRVGFEIKREIIDAIDSLNIRREE